MKLAFVSTYPPTQCGIGIYTRKLARALAEGAHPPALTIVAERDGYAAYDDEGIRCEPIYERGEDYVEPILGALRAAKIEIVHFQHAPDLFGEDARFVRLLAAAQAAGIATVITPHTVHGESHRERHRQLGAHADALIAHQQASMADRLIEHGVAPDSVHVIPHGTTRMQLPARDASRASCGLRPEGTVFLFFGFVHGKKNVHTVLEAFLRIASRRSEAQLVIAGRPWDHRWYNRLYLALLRARARVSGARARVHFLERFIPDEEVPRLFSAADVILLPHRQAYGSASGVLHQALGSGNAFLCARGPKFENAEGAFADVPEVFVPPGAIAAWAEAMDAFCADTGLRDRCRAGARLFAEQTSWEHVAEQHRRVYERALEARRADVR